jgi:hypothetical protein
VYHTAANEIAGFPGNARVANMVLLGAYLELTGVVSIKPVITGKHNAVHPAGGLPPAGMRGLLSTECFLHAGFIFRAGLRFGCP